MYAVNAVAIGRSQKQANGAKHDVKAEHGPHVEHRGLFKQLIAHQNLHRVEVGIPRCGRHGAAQRDGYANGGGHDRYFHDGDANKKARVLAQLRDGELAVSEAENAQQNRQHELGNQNDSVRRIHQIGDIHADERVNQARDSKHHNGHKGDAGIALHRKDEIGAEAPTMGDKRHKPAYPKHDKDQVPQERIGAVIMVTARRGVAFHANGHDLHYGQEKQDRLHGPATAHEPENAHYQGNEHGDCPHDGGGNFRQRHFHDGRLEYLGKGRAGEVGHNERDFHEPHDRHTEGSPGAGAGGDVAVDGQGGIDKRGIVTARSDEEGRGQE